MVIVLLYLIIKQMPRNKTKKAKQGRKRHKVQQSMEEKPQLSQVNHLLQQIKRQQNISQNNEVIAEKQLEKTRKIEETPELSQNIQAEQQRKNETIDPRKICQEKLSSLLGLPSWVRTSMTYDQKQEQWVVIYSIAKKNINENMVQQIDLIRDVIKRNKHIVSFCKTYTREEKDQFVIEVRQENIFSCLEPPKTPITVSRLLKQAMKAIYKLQGEYPRKTRFFLSEKGISVRYKVVKVNFIQGYLQNYGKEDIPHLMQHLANIFESFVNNSIYFKKKVNQNNSTYETFNHFLSYLRANKILPAYLHKKHPLFLSISERIMLISLTYDKTIESFSFDYSKKVTFEQFLNYKNAFFDKIQHQAFIQRIDADPNNKRFSYDWLSNMSQKFNQIVNKFRTFKKEKTSSKGNLYKERFISHLTFIRNLLRHICQYKKDCKEQFNTHDSQEIFSKLENYFPRFITFVFDFNNALKTYFDAVDQGLQPGPLFFTPRKELENDDIILEREEQVFKQFYNETLLPYAICKRKQLKHSQLVKQFQSKIDFYAILGKTYIDWEKNIPIDKAVYSNCQKQLKINKIDIPKQIIRPYLLLKEAWDVAISQSNETMKKNIMRIYYKVGSPQSVYSCVNNLNKKIDENKQRNEIPFLEEEKQILDKLRMSSSKKLDNPQNPNQHVQMISIDSDSQSEVENSQEIIIEKVRRKKERLRDQRQKTKNNNNENENKNKLVKIITKFQPCQDYYKGYCPKGGNCLKDHRPLCRDYIKMDCKRKSHCKDLHVDICFLRDVRKCLNRKNNQCSKTHINLCSKFLVTKERCQAGQCIYFHPPCEICQQDLDDNCQTYKCKKYHLSLQEIDHF